jgi:hypothetical protein
MQRAIGFGWALALAGWAVAAPASKAPADPAAGPPYYPTAVGTKWVYDQNGREMTWEVSAAEARAGETLVTITQTITGGEPEAIVKTSVSARGVYKLEVGPFKIDPVCELRFPVKAGDTWPVHVPSQKGGLQGWTGTVTVGDVEEIEVPAGKFRAVRVDVVMTGEGGRVLAEPRRHTNWYAPGVGLVKTTSGKDPNRALKAFTPGKK